jgi:hypothetical protein
MPRSVEPLLDDIFIRRLAGLVPQDDACEECHGLSGKGEQPPIHPNCRCDYEED